MAWIRLLQPYNNEAPGAIIEVPGGLASVLILRGVAQVSATRHETEPPPHRPIAAQAAQAAQSAQALNSCPSPITPPIRRKRRWKLW